MEQYEQGVMQCGVGKGDYITQEKLVKWEAAGDKRRETGMRHAECWGFTVTLSNLNITVLIKIFNPPPILQMRKMNAKEIKECS